MTYNWYDLKLNGFQILSFQFLFSHFSNKLSANWYFQPRMIERQYVKLANKYNSNVQVNV